MTQLSRNGRRFSRPASNPASSARRERDGEDGKDDKENRRGVMSESAGSPGTRPPPIKRVGIQRSCPALTPSRCTRQAKNAKLNVKNALVQGLEVWAAADPSRLNTVLDGSDRLWEVPDTHSPERFHTDARSWQILRDDGVFSSKDHSQQDAQTMASPTRPVYPVALTASTWQERLFISSSNAPLDFWSRFVPLQDDKSLTEELRAAIARHVGIRNARSQKAKRAAAKTRKAAAKTRKAAPRAGPPQDERAS